MIEAPIYTQEGKKDGVVALPERLFTLPKNDALVQQVVTCIAANRRSGTAHTKGRSDVSGGGKKPWKQKGTGRARHGSIRSPLWVGGGVTFGPTKDKNYTAVVNKKMGAKALFTVLSEKLRNDSIMFINEFSVDNPSTKIATECIKKIHGVSAEKRKNMCLIVFSENNELARKSFANIKGIATIALTACNARDALIAKKIVFINPTESLKQLEERGASVKNT